MKIYFTLLFPLHLPRPIYDGYKIGRVWKDFDWVVPEKGVAVEFGDIECRVDEVTHHLGKSVWVDLRPTYPCDLVTMSKAVGRLIEEDGWLANV